MGASLTKTVAAANFVAFWRQKFGSFINFIMQATHKKRFNYDAWLLEEAAFCQQEYLPPHTSHCRYAWPYANALLPAEEVVINDADVIDGAVEEIAVLVVEVPAPVAPRRTSVVDRIVNGFGDAAGIVAEKGVVGGATDVAVLAFGGSADLLNMFWRRVSGDAGAQAAA